MRGKIRSINSRSDMQAAKLTDEQIIKMATQDVIYDDAKYPPGYDKKLNPGDSGYIPPILRTETIIDEGVLRRFAVTIEVRGQNAPTEQ